MKVLVTGGAGYIGSHTCKALAKRGLTPITYDNLERGHRSAIQWGPFYQGDVLETEKLAKILKDENIEAVFHFAALAYVGESVVKPIQYYQNNVLGSVSLIEAMKKADVRKIIFSSTCATYGLPKEIPIRENTKQMPINPYGQSKYMVEQILRDCAAAGDLSVVALRYFNASGADADGDIGETHTPETHLIPLALDVAFGRSKQLTIFGDDYETVDGTCVRDYVHVTDLAEAHVLAFELATAAEFQAYNLGTGQGVSVREIIQSVEKVTKHKVSVEIGKRRAGDPPRLIASGEKAENELGWKPKHSSLENIVVTASRWHEKQILKT
ncbi:MAG: UDP-glucose 4-epimerase GalE [Pseudobdellovibrionaceae bacterium]